MLDLRKILMLILLASCSILLALGEPSGVSIISNETESPTPQGAASITTAGGSFTTLILNATTQTMRWKAYVGNVTGSLTLDDASDFTIYDWSLTTITGEVYASRNNSVDWSQIQCAQESTITEEQDQLGHTSANPDNINKTFNETTHTDFYVGTTYIAASNCRAISTYKNNSRQNVSEDADFQEILLGDSSSLIYTTLLEQDVAGYNNAPFDFQMIVAESSTASQSSTYYFWAELS